MDADRYVFVSTAGVYRDWPHRPVAGRARAAATRATRRTTASSRRRASGRWTPSCRAASRTSGRGSSSARTRTSGACRRGWSGWRAEAPWWPRSPRTPPIQLVDVRDLATLLLDAPPGAYNAVTPVGAITWGEFLETCRDVTGGGAELVWTDPERVLEVVDESWNELPLWPPPSLPGVFAIAPSAALRTRPLRETIEDTWAWLSGPGGGLSDWRSEVRASGLSPERERALLA